MWALWKHVTWSPSVLLREAAPREVRWLTRSENWQSKNESLHSRCLRGHGPRHMVTFNLPGMQVNKIWLKDINLQGKAWFR